MYQSSKPKPCKLLLTFVLVVLMTVTDANKNRLTSNSGVCFHGKTAERVLSILATCTYRSVLPPEHTVRDCSDLDRKHYRSGVYTIYPEVGAGYKAFCDMETDGGGWTLKD